MKRRREACICSCGEHCSRSAGSFFEHRVFSSDCQWSTVVSTVKTWLGPPPRLSWWSTVWSNYLNNHVKCTLFSTLSYHLRVHDIFRCPSRCARLWYTHDFIWCFILMMNNYQPRLSALLCRLELDPPWIVPTSQLLGRSTDSAAVSSLPTTDNSKQLVSKSSTAPGRLNPC